MQNPSNPKLKNSEKYYWFFASFSKFWSFLAVFFFWRFRNSQKCNLQTKNSAKNDCKCKKILTRVDPNLYFLDPKVTREIFLLTRKNTKKPETRLEQNQKTRNPARGQKNWPDPPLIFIFCNFNSLEWVLFLFYHILIIKQILTLILALKIHLFA